MFFPVVSVAGRDCAVKYRRSDLGGGLSTCTRACNPDEASRTWSAKRKNLQRALRRAAAARDRARTEASSAAADAQAMKADNAHYEQTHYEPLLRVPCS